MKHNIGVNAGIIWHLLLEKGTLTIEKLEKLIEFERHELMMALGWLMRENKIDFHHHGENLHVRLSDSNFYF